MEESEILQQFTQVFANQIDQPNVKLEMDTKPYEIEDWDSLFNILLLVAIEKHFGIKFLNSDLANFRTVGNWVQTIKAKLAQH